MSTGCCLTSCEKLANKSMRRSRLSAACVMLWMFLLNVVDSFHISITYGSLDGSATFDPATFLRDLAGHMNAIAVSRLSISEQPAPRGNNQWVLKVHVGEGKDHPTLKKKAFMLPFGGRHVAGFNVIHVEIHEDEPWRPPTPQLLKVGCIMDAPPETTTIATIESALQLPAGSLVQKEVKHTVVPKEAFQGANWIQLQSTNGGSANGWFTSGVTAFFEFHSDNDALLDRAVLKAVDLPWTISHVVSVASGVIRDRVPPPPPDHPVDDGAPCGSSGRELCIVAVIKGSAVDASSFQWKCRLAHYLRVHNNRVRFVTHTATISDHPTWADIKIDHEFKNDQHATPLGLSQATFAIGEGDPSLDSVHGHMITEFFHAPELVLGFVDHHLELVPRFRRSTLLLEFPNLAIEICDHIHSLDVIWVCSNPLVHLTL